jgi:hypothetical protein
MYEYEFFRIDLGFGFDREPSQDYHELINEQAKSGWRLVQIFAPPTHGVGKATFYELIFEREIK